jgi:hypothetical protein
MVEADRTTVSQKFKSIGVLEFKGKHCGEIQKIKALIGVPNRGNDPWDDLNSGIILQLLNSCNSAFRLLNPCGVH